MRPEEFDQILPNPEPVDPALLDRISASLCTELRPVRPLPSVAVLSAILLVIFSAAAVTGAARLGFLGLAKLSTSQAALIFSLLVAFAILASVSAARAMIPGAKHPVSSGVVLAGSILIMAAAFTLLFSDLRTDGFVVQGVACLKAGLIWATPAGIGAWLVLRRGFAVDPPAAGIASGTFAGLAGLTMLELHCPNFRLWHVMVWHVAVVPVCGLVVWVVYSFFWKRKAAELMQ
jgi:hypothetical protein